MEGLGDMFAQQQAHAQIIDEAAGAEADTIFQATFMSEAGSFVQCDSSHVS